MTPYQLPFPKEALEEIVVPEDVDEMITYFQVNGVMVDVDQFIR